MLDTHLDTEANDKLNTEVDTDEPTQDEPSRDETEKDETEIAEEYFEIVSALLVIYPEFKDILKTQEQVDNFLAIIDQVRCLYPEFNDLKKCQNKYPFFMLIAHYAVMAGLTKSIGIYAQNGLVASSSIDGVSVSYQSSPYSTKGDELTYYLSLTPYGLQYLAWLARQAGLKIVN